MANAEAALARETAGKLSEADASVEEDLRARIARLEAKEPHECLEI
ncbi:MAG: hypothetical protein IPK13_27835 [Deltaproteobacteria bacterium]|nr:hypothetical protein [Deltaproteobacteria bacterium]